MRSYIFITDEGYTFEPGDEHPTPAIENSQVIGFADGRDAKDAFSNLIKEQSFLLNTNFNEVAAIEVRDSEREYFYLNAP